jgi:acyl transferase domain-containing protein
MKKGRNGWPVEKSMNYEEIAIIAMTGRFPGADNIDVFWENLSNSVESVSFFSSEELLEAGVAPEFLNDPNYVKARPVLSDAELFDAEFFGYSPREAENIDPQHRLFLQCAWEVLEKAAYNPENCESRIGVYAGAAVNAYLLNSYSHNGGFLDSTDSYFRLMLGSEKDYLSTRVSYKLNLTGPSLTVQTACSSSLVAVHLAAQALQNRECDMALAGGVTVRIPQKAGYFYRKGLPLSPDGHCRAFDAQAGGTTFGSGIGIVLLKRLADAVADGDYIYAIIKGSAVNNDGALKAGFTAPSVKGQASVISQALSNARISPDTISCIEAHGTGTKLGDPIEMAALNQVFQSSTREKNYCAVSSVKTNIGHLIAAAGITGLIKTVLALEHKKLPPSLNFEQPNPEIDFDNSPFYINTHLSEWTIGKGIPRRAGISSFGFGGTNAHVILEEAVF